MAGDTEKQTYVHALGSFVPVSDAARDFLRKTKVGDIVELHGSKPRNLKHHRKFFELLKIILANQDFYKSMDELLAVCKLAIGHVEIVRTKYGDVRIPKSISFASMDQSAFDAFYDRAIDWACTDVIQGLARKDLANAVEREIMSF